MLEGKVAWITGGASGIGLAGALELQKLGAKVVVSGRNEATLRKAPFEGVLCDVADKKQVAAAAADVEKRHGRIDILVASAGINLPKRNFRDVTLEGWDEIVAVNLSGVFYCVQAVLPGMRRRKDGVIINVSSWAGRYPSALTEQINIEECGNNIRATALLPGEAATPILEKRPVPPPPGVRAKMLQAEDLGAAIAFIAALPARACVNELVMSPTWNRFLLGGLEAPK